MSPLNENKKKYLIPAIIIGAFILTAAFLSIDTTLTPNSSLNTNLVETKSQEKSEVDIYLYRNIPAEIKLGDQIEVTLELFYHQTQNMDLYEKLPSGFRIVSEEIDRSPEFRIFKELDNNIYLYEISKNNKPPKIRIDYILEVSEKVTLRTYKIEGWVEAGGERIASTSSEIKIVN